LSGTETILVVVDQKHLRKMAEDVLRNSGYRVLEAANSGEALLHCERQADPIHLMVTDLAMPGITGPELARRVRPMRPAMEVIFMQSSSVRTLTDRLALPASYLSHRLSPDPLATRVRGVLGLPRSLGTILVADDEPGIRKFLRDVLNSVCYEVFEAENGKEVIQQVEVSEIDLVIMDLAMPVQEGIETIQDLRRIRPQIKIIAISGRFEHLLGAAKSLGAQVALAKPIQRDDLLDAVARVLG
jgi:CheY-like chemotaxis protein